MSSSHDDPLVPALILVHGLFGYGEERPLYGRMPDYFPLAHLRRTWRGAVRAVNVGVAASAHDCACEAFAQLAGTFTDYGEVHARECGHARHGPDFRGRALLERWDASRPVHLVGHSFGGNTALALLQLLADDFWGLGTDARWVVSITCIATPVRGCSLPFALGLQPRGAEGGHRHDHDGESLALFTPVHFLSIVLGTLWMAQRRWPALSGLYRFRLDHWPPPRSLRALCTADHEYWRTADNVLNEASPATRHSSFRQVRRHLSGLYLVAVTSDSVAPLAPRDASAAVGRSTARALALVGVALAARRAARSPALRLAVGRRALPLAVSAAAAAAAALAVGRVEPRDLMPTRLAAAAVHTLLRLSSFMIHRTATTLRGADGMHASRGNDGLIDIDAQLGVCVGSSGGGGDGGGASLAALAGGGGGNPLRRVAGSAQQLSRADDGSPVRWRAADAAEQPTPSPGDLVRAALSHPDLGDMEAPMELGDGGGAAARPLQRGCWRVLHVAGADHRLGTQLAGETSEEMYTALCAMLERVR